MMDWGIRRKFKRLNVCVCVRTFTFPFAPLFDVSPEERKPFRIVLLHVTEKYKNYFRNAVAYPEKGRRKSLPST